MSTVLFIATEEKGGREDCSVFYSWYAIKARRMMTGANVAATNEHEWKNLIAPHAAACSVLVTFPDDTYIDVDEDR